MLACSLVSSKLLCFLAIVSVNARPRPTLISSIAASSTVISATAATTLVPTATIIAPQSMNTAVLPLGSNTDMFVQNQACRASWIPAATSINAWKNMTIDLMTGSNLQMTKLATVVSGIDGTDPNVTTYNYSCPIVSPNAAIYFLQYTHDAQQDPAWTTRFAIANLAGIYFPAPNANQPQGGIPAIPWGQGVLVNTASLSSSTAVISAGFTASMTASNARSSYSTTQQSGSVTLLRSSILCIFAILIAVVAPFTL